MEKYSEGELLDRSLEEILRLEREGIITKTNARRMETLVNHSSYGQVYAVSILDPNLRDRLEHNKVLRNDAEEYGIDLERWHAGIEDTPLRLKLEKEAKLKKDKIHSYLIEAFEIIDDFKEKSYMAFEYFTEEYTHLNYERLVQKYWEKDYIEFVNDLFGYALSEESEERYIEVLEELEGTIEFAHDYFFMDDSERKAIIDQILPSLVESDRDIFEKDLESKVEKRLNEVNLLSCYNNWQNTEKIEYEGKLKDTLTSLRELMDPHSIKNKFFKRLFNTFENGNGEAVLNDYTYVTVQDFDTMKIHNLRSHVSEIEDPNLISTRIKNVAEAEYSCQVEELLARDVSFGNNGGCCIAVNILNEDNGDEIGNEDSVPFYQLDQGTIIVGIYQKAVLSKSNNILNRKKRRVGMLLVHAGANLENRAVQAVNSLELSSSMNPLSKKSLEKLTKHCLRYVDQLGLESGFEGLAMGNHNYNTAFNYLPENLKFRSLLKDKKKKDEIMKLPDHVSEGEQKWYSEIFDEKGNSKENTIIWIRKPGEKNILK